MPTFNLSDLSLTPTVREVCRAAIDAIGSEAEFIRRCADAADPETYGSNDVKRLTHGVVIVLRGFLQDDLDLLAERDA